MMDFHLSKDWKVWVYLTCGTVLGGVELYAAITGPSGDTISERVWSVGWPFATVVGLGMMVLGIHFAFQGREETVARKWEEVKAESGLDEERVAALTDELLVHQEMYANNPEYRAAYDATVEHNERWMAGEETHEGEDEG